MSGRRNDPLFDDEVARLTRQGLTAPEISRRLDVPLRRVQRARQRSGTSRPLGYTLMTEEEKRWAKILLDEGAPYGEVARSLGRTIQTIQRNLPGYTWSREQVTRYMIDCSAAARRGKRMKKR